VSRDGGGARSSTSLHRWRSTYTTAASCTVTRPRTCSSDSNGYRLPGTLVQVKVLNESNCTFTLRDLGCECLRTCSSRTATTTQTGMPPALSSMFIGAVHRQINTRLGGSGVRSAAAKQQRPQLLCGLARRHCASYREYPECQWHCDSDCSWISFRQKAFVL
jgi:hypothetical protein